MNLNLALMAILLVASAMAFRNTKHPMRYSLLAIFTVLLLVWGSKQLWGQTAVVQSPVPKFRDFIASGAPNAQGCVYTYQSGTSTPQATYTDATGSIQNSNPVVLDGNGEAQIWVTASAYRFKVYTHGSGSLGNNCGGGSLRYQIDGIADKGLQGQAGGSLLLNPGGHINQTVVGPITADQFTGPATAATKSFTRQTTTNNPSDNTVAPALPGQVYNIPDPGAGGNYVINPSGNSGTGNTLDCTLAGITCKRTAQFYFRGAQCNNATPGVAFDTFPTNAPAALCITGTNIQKGAMGLPSAYTHVQQSAGNSSAAGTITTTYPAATVGGNGDLLVAAIVFNATTTITGCTDGTNAYSQAKHVATGSLSLDIWVFHNATTKAAGTTLTCTFAAPATGSMKWHEYVAPNATSTDVSASATGTSSTPATGTTASTAQATELIFAAAGFSDATDRPMSATTSGYSDHSRNSSNGLQMDDAGTIQQVVATQSASFTISASETWAAAIVAFKATNASSIIAQQTITLPTFFNAAQAINTAFKWTTALPGVGSTTASLGAALGCTTDGATDDSALNADSTATVTVSNTGGNLPATTTLSGLTATGCAAGNVLHYQIKRLRYSTSDIYEGYIQVIGNQLQVGVTQ